MNSTGGGSRRSGGIPAEAGGLHTVQYRTPTIPTLAFRRTGIVQHGAVFYCDSIHHAPENIATASGGGVSMSRLALDMKNWHTAQVAATKPSTTANGWRSVLPVIC